MEGDDPGRCGSAAIAGAAQRQMIRGGVRLMGMIVVLGIGSGRGGRGVRVTVVVGIRLRRVRMAVEEVRGGLARPEVLLFRDVHVRGEGRGEEAERDQRGEATRSGA